MADNTNLEFRAQAREPGCVSGTLLLATLGVKPGAQSYAELLARVGASLCLICGWGGAAWRQRWALYKLPSFVSKKGSVLQLVLQAMGDDGSKPFLRNDMFWEPRPGYDCRLRV